jgi:hypothetical protein
MAGEGKVVPQKFIKKLQTMAMVEAAHKSPSFPLLQGEKFRSKTLTPLWKRGERGDFGRTEAESCRELVGQDSTQWTSDGLHRIKS